MEKLTRPFRYPNSVPVTQWLLEEDRWWWWWWWPSVKLAGSAGILHAVGVMIGNDRKTERKTRMTLVLLWDRFFADGWTRDTSCRGGAGGETGGGGGRGGRDVLDGRSTEFR